MGGPGATRDATPDVVGDSFNAEEVGDRRFAHFCGDVQTGTSLNIDDATTTLPDQYVCDIPAQFGTQLVMPKPVPCPSFGVVGGDQIGFQPHHVNVRMHPMLKPAE